MELITMNNKVTASLDNTLDHPLTLKLYLYFKSKEPKEIGIREAQRALSIKSPSTVSWHLEKLVESNYVEKLPTNRYILSDNGKEMQELKIPVLVPAQTFRGIVFPRIIFLLSFLVTSIVIAIIIVWIHPMSAAIWGIVSLVTSLILGLREYIYLRDQFKFYSFLKERRNE